MWMKTIQKDLKSNNLSLNEAINVVQNGLLWRLMSTYGDTLLVVHTTKEEEEEEKDMAYSHRPN